jgi:hypothetical protein
VVKRCLFVGWPGWYYALQRAVAEALIAIEIVDRRLQSAPANEIEPAPSRHDRPRP